MLGLVNKLAWKIEPFTRKGSRVNNLARTVRLCPRIAFHSVSLSEEKVFRDNFHLFVDKNLNASVDQVDEFFYKSGYWIMPEDISNLAPEKQKQVLRMQIKKINSAFNCVEKLKNTSQRIKYTDYLVDCYSSMLVSLIGEEKLGISLADRTIPFVKACGFVMNPKITDPSLSMRKHENMQRKNFFLPANLTELPFGKDSKEFEALVEILGPFIDLSDVLNNPVIEVSLGLGQYYIAGMAAAGFISYNSDLNSVSHRQIEEINSRLQYAGSIVDDVITESSRFRNAVLAHELVHQILKTRVKDISLSSLNYFSDCNLVNKSRVYKLASNSVANEILAHSVELFLSPNKCLQSLVSQRESYLGPSKDIIRDCLDDFCRKNGIEFKTNPDTPRAIIELIGEENYKAFLSELKDVFRDLSHQILAHLKSKNLILSEADPNLATKLRKPTFF